MQIPKKISSRIVKKEKISSSRNQSVAKDFCVNGTVLVLTFRKDH